MVAPRLTTQLTRSLVRIPNSGAERPREAQLLDLSNVSAAAAQVPAMQDLPSNLFPSQRYTQSRSIPIPTDCGPVKPPKRTTSASEPHPSVGNGLVQERTATLVIPSRPSSEATATSSVETEPRADTQRGALLPLQAANGNVMTPTATPSTMSPAGGRKRLLPVVKDAPRPTAAVTAGDTKSAKVRKTTAAKPGPQPRRTPSRSRATKDQLWAFIDQLLSENEALRSGNEAYKNYFYYQSMLNQQALAIRTGTHTSSLQVH